MAQELHNIYCAPAKNLHLVRNVSPFVALSPAVYHERIIFLIHSSFTTTTPEHAPQSGQHDILQEYPVHHQPLQDLPVDKQRHKEPHWRENLQSGETRANILHNIKNAFHHILRPDLLETGCIVGSESCKKLCYSMFFTDLTPPALHRLHFVISDFRPPFVLARRLFGDCSRVVPLEVIRGLLKVLLGDR